MGDPTHVHLPGWVCSFGTQCERIHTKLGGSEFVITKYTTRCDYTCEWGIHMMFESLFICDKLCISFEYEFIIESQ